MNSLRSLFVVAILFLPLTQVGAENSAPSPAADTLQPISQPKAGESAPLVFWNRRITVFRSYYEKVSPSERAAGAVERLEAIPEAAEWVIVANPTSSGQYSGVLVTVNNQLAFGILTGDLDTESGETLQTASNAAVVQLRGALEARSQQKKFSVFARGLGLSIVATLIALFGLWVVLRLGRQMRTRFEQAASARRLIARAGFDLRPILHAINRGLVKITMWAAGVTVVYLWLMYVLLRFPYSQPWGQQLSAFLINLLGSLGNRLIHAVPGMFTVIVIFLLTRIVARLASGFFDGVDRGSVGLSWMHRDTAGATRRLVMVLIWIFAITVAYPYIPGSDTDAFKGVSVFVGLMISLGSAGLVNQVMSGLVVIYSRALKPGEYVSIGDDFGTVSEVGMLSTKLITRKREEITIPNAVLVGTKTVNYSRQATDGAAQISTTITIGYDAPWRLVHSMLLHAADQTSGLRKDPAPRVWQKALSDFYVEYELVVHLDQPSERVPILSELHMHIQDAFNENGVQIMSPHFESQPHEKVFVPKSQWFPSASSGSTKQNGDDQLPQPAVKS
ncbi:MAG TPA: mechanosensitive ion channel family protein [Pyrinomonadaceae bacterium]|nr:mechanosensitive ion channel family protein [Pyrinomonadaceae bacterium]